MKRNTNTGCMENNNFADLLNKFDECKTKPEWEALIEETKTREPLTGRQREAIVARCNNQLNGTYGKTKKDGNFGHTKIS